MAAQPALMTSYIKLPVGEEHLEPILDRKNQIISKVEAILPTAKVEKVTRRFNEKLEEIRQIFRDCSLLNAELREMSPLEHVFLGVGDVARDADVSISYVRSATKDSAVQERPQTSEVSATTAESTAAKAPVQSPEVISGNAIIPSITPEEFEIIPKYMRGRMTLSELNDIVGKLDEFLSMKRSLLNAPFKKLPMKDKDQVCKWKEQEPTPIVGQLFCQEADVKPLMKDRSRALFRTALPCLRHVRRIKEVRHRGQVYILPEQ
ncbi:hypothetical protein OSTOST_04965 [Ostertagia ostertagi]